MTAEAFSNLNWLHILVAAIGYFAVGAVWYSPVGFSKKWIAYTNIDMNDPNLKKGVAGIMIGSVVLMFINCIGLALLINTLQVNDWMGGLKLGLLTGICFCMTSISISLLYEKKPLGLHLINGGYNLVGNVVAAIILACWQ